VGGADIRGLLCDDAPGFRALMRDTLDEDPDVVVVGEAADGEADLQAIADLPRRRPPRHLRDQRCGPRRGRRAPGPSA
jgi:hypothetical protein